MTHPSDLRAYAERLAEYDLADWQGPTGDCTNMRAAIVLARAYLAEHPADEGEAVTEERLKAIGLYVKPGYGFPLTPVLSIWNTRNGWKVFYHAGEGDSFTTEHDGDFLLLNTMSDVRRILKALGVPHQ